MSARCLGNSLLVAITLLSSVIPARADIIFYSSGGDFSSKLQSLGMQDQNVLFNGTGVVHGPALTVTGVTNLSNLPVNITSSENLTGLGGQAPAVQATDGAFASATITFADPNMHIQSLFFNLDNAPAVSQVLVRFTVTDGNGNVSFTDIVNNGNNFFGVIAFNGDSLLSGKVEVISNLAAPQDLLDQLFQLRISGSAAAAEPGVFSTPEPTTWLIWGLIGVGLSLFAFYGRTRLQPQPIR